MGSIPGHSIFQGNVLPLHSLIYLEKYVPKALIFHLFQKYRYSDKYLSIPTSFYVLDINLEMASLSSPIKQYILIIETSESHSHVSLSHVLVQGALTFFNQVEISI